LAGEVGIEPDALAARMDWNGIEEWLNEIELGKRKNLRTLAVVIGHAVAYGFGSMEKQKFESFLENLSPSPKQAPADHADIDRMKARGLPIEDAV
jgi:hypothetical protein